MERRTRKYWENRPEVYQMLFSEFAHEYAELLPVMQAKEGKIGKLDPHAPDYVPMTEEETALHAKDWKAFSRSRGFGEYDIAQYGRWRKLTGQADGLEYAINDPWRRGVTDWDLQLYLKHIEYAEKKGIKLEPQIERSYFSAKRKLSVRDFQNALRNLMVKRNAPAVAQNPARHKENDEW